MPAQVMTLPPRSQLSTFIRPQRKKTVTRGEVKTGLDKLLFILSPVLMVSYMLYFPLLPCLLLTVIVSM